MPVLGLICLRHADNRFKTGLPEIEADIPSRQDKPDHIAALSVPDHREIAKGTLRSLTRAAELTIEAFAVEAEKL